MAEKSNKPIILNEEFSKEKELIIRIRSIK